MQKSAKLTAKSDFLEYLYQEKVSMKNYQWVWPTRGRRTVVDSAAIVQMNALKIETTFGEYSTVEIGDKVRFLPACVQQLDKMFDVYQKISKGAETWWQ